MRATVLLACLVEIRLRFVPHGVDAVVGSRVSDHVPVARVGHTLIVTLSPCSRCQI